MIWEFLCVTGKIQLRVDDVVYTYVPTVWKLKIAFARMQLIYCVVECRNAYRIIIPLRTSLKTTKRRDNFFYKNGRIWVLVIYTHLRIFSFNRERDGFNKTYISCGFARE